MKALKKKKPTWAKSAGDANLSKMAVLALHPSPILGTLIYSYYALCSSLFSFFLLTGNLNINPPSPPPPAPLACHLLFLSTSLFEKISTFLRRRHSLCRSQNSRAHTCTKKNPPLMQMRFRGRSGEVSDQSSLIPGI